MFIRNRDYGNYIQKIRINLGHEFGLEAPEDAYIVLRELNTMEVTEMKIVMTEGEEEILRYFGKLIPKVLVEHNFCEDEKTPMTNDAVSEIIFERLETSNKVIEEYSTGLLQFPKRGAKKGNKSGKQ